MPFLISQYPSEITSDSMIRIPNLEPPYDEAYLPDHIWDLINYLFIKQQKNVIRFKNRTVQCDFTLYLAQTDLWKVIWFGRDFLVILAWWIECANLVNQYWSMESNCRKWDTYFLTRKSASMTLRSRMFTTEWCSRAAALITNIEPWRPDKNLFCRSLVCIL